MCYNLHPYSDCSPYRRNGTGLAFRTSEKAGALPYQELRRYLHVQLKAKRSKPKGRVLRLSK
jgi:hypothetical protein